MKIVADLQIPYVKEYFGVYGECILKSGREISPIDVKTADILLVRSITQVNEALLKNSSVKFVGSVTAGSDHLAMAWLDRVGIPYSVAEGFNAPPVADYVVSVIAALKRKGLLKQKRPKAAVIGVGYVGKLVASRLALLNFDVILCDPIRAQSEKTFVSHPLSTIADVDFISLHVPLTHQGEHATHHLINRSFLEKQKKGCILLNASRGAVIHSQDLLRYGNHLQWCLDVFEHEPMIDKAILEGALMATPHIAGYSVQSKIRGIDMIYRIACEKKIILPQSITPIAMPKNRLVFSDGNHHWQEIVLGVFNPSLMTNMMRSQLLPSNDLGSLFDTMRNQFTYRHEFAFTTWVGSVATTEDEVILAKLGLTQALS